MDGRRGSVDWTRGSGTRGVRMIWCDGIKPGVLRNRTGDGRLTFQGRVETWTNFRSVPYEVGTR